MWSVFELKTKRPKLIITWLPLNAEGSVGVSLNLGVYEGYLTPLKNTGFVTIGIFWVEVKYNEDKSLLISSVIGTHPSLGEFGS